MTLVNIKHIKDYIFTECPLHYTDGVENSKSQKKLKMGFTGCHIFLLYHVLNTSNVEMGKTFLTKDKTNIPKI